MVGKARASVRARSQLDAVAWDVLRRGGVWIAIVALIAVIHVLSPALVAPEQLATIARQGAPLGIVAIGQTVVILGGGFDLSVGGIVAFSNVLAAGIIGSGGFLASASGSAPTLVIVTSCLVAGALIGAINGFGVAIGRISPLIMTLGMTFILSGAALIYTGGAPSGSLPAGIIQLSLARFYGVPVIAIVWILLAALAIGVLRLARPGHYLYAVGNNRSASRLAGIPVARTQFFTYVFSGVCAALAGVLLAGYVGQGSLGAGQDYMLQSVAAVVLGGTVLEGGKGGVSGTVGGVFFLAMVGAILTGMNAQESGNLIATGIVIAVAAALYRRRSVQ